MATKTTSSIYDMKLVIMRSLVSYPSIHFRVSFDPSILYRSLKSQNERILFYLSITRFIKPLRILFGKEERCLFYSLSSLFLQTLEDSFWKRREMSFLFSQFLVFTNPWGFFYWNEWEMSFPISRFLVFTNPGALFCWNERCLSPSPSMDS